MRCRLAVLCFLLAFFGFSAAAAQAGGLVQLPLETDAPAIVSTASSATDLADSEAGDFESRLLSYALVEQTNLRYYEVDRLVYVGETFGNNGCGPSSIANALITALGVTDWDTSDNLLADVIRVMRDMPYDPDDIVSIGNLYRLTTSESDAFTTWRSLRDAFPGSIAAWGETRTLPEIQTELNRLQADGGSALLICRYDLENNWRNVLTLCHQLYEEGHRDALIIGFFLSAGTAGSDTPFYTSTGHFETLCIHVGMLEEEGRVYLLDSFPRACNWDEEENFRNWYGIYPFIYRSSEYAFNAAFEVNRLSRVVLRLQLRPSLLNAQRTLLTSGQKLDALLDSQVTWMSSLQLMGAGGFAVMIP